MTQLSMPWNGVTTGDATAAPYDAPDEWARIWRSIAGAAAIPTHLSGVFAGELNALAVTGSTTPVAVATGRALVYGTWYQSDAIENIAIPTPSGATRIDYIVLRKDWALQTVRVTRIAGAEGGAAPPLVQLDGTTWDQPLAQVSITTGGVITVTDERQFLVSGIVGGSAGEVLQPSGSTGLPTWTRDPSIAGTLSFMTAASRIIPGATSISLRNNANSADNLIITDAGVVTLRNQLVISSGGAAITGNSSIVGTLTGLTGLTSSGNIAFSGLTANRLVVKGATNLESSISSANLRSSVTDPTGTGALVFATSPALTTPTITGLTTIAGAAGAQRELLRLVNPDALGGGAGGSWISFFGATSTEGARVFASGESATAMNLDLYTLVGGALHQAARVQGSNGGLRIFAPISGVGLTVDGGGANVTGTVQAGSVQTNTVFDVLSITAVAGSNLSINVGLAQQVAINVNAIQKFAVSNTNTTISNILTVDNEGIVAGAPTGGNKGVGTINVATDVYKNNSAYANPDYVFEHYFTNQIVKYKANPGADLYGGLMPLNDLREYVRENWRFPGITDEAMGMFDRGDHALRLIEMNALYLFDHEDRITKLEEKVLV